MTGFGRAEVSDSTCVITVEARSVNHRHLDIALRLPPVLAPLELAARRLIQARLDRGRIDVSAQLAPTVGVSAQEVRINTALARRFHDEARSLAGSLGLEAQGLLRWVLERPGVMELREAGAPDPEGLESLLARGVSEALDALLARRTAEGAALSAELRALLAELGGRLATMAQRAPLAAARRGERLRERLQALLGDIPVDEARIVTEVAVWAQKTDVTEEIARLRVHLDEFALTLDKGGPVGRGLDFLLQEMNREVNTLSAKADDLELSQAALAAKGLLEKMREQVQNLE
ncbi:MAG: YicC/YloC family endoribonuclease [Candidatus Rokuibacteriota bacterium]